MADEKISIDRWVRLGSLFSEVYFTETVSEIQFSPIMHALNFNGIVFYVEPHFFDRFGIQIY